MQRLLSLVGALMLVLMVWTGTTAHAAETYDCAPVSADAAGHYDGDRDQVPADQGSGVAHHHSGCSGHHIAAPVNATQLQLTLGDTDPSLPSDDQRADSLSPDNQLRPPIA